MNLLRNIVCRVLEAAGDEAGGGGGGGDGQEGAQAAERTAMEQRARDMGWSPKDQWRGDSNSWIDAPEFVQRGEQMLPILRANLRKTEAELASVRGEMKKQGTLLQAANESIQVLTNLSTEQTKQAAKEKRRELLREQAKARSDGNTDLEIDLGEQIADVTSQINAVEEEAEEGAPPTTARRKAGGKAVVKQQQQSNTTSSNENPTIDPAFQTWQSENQWFGVDRRKTAMATAIAEELRADQANNSLQGKAFYDRVAVEVNKIFGGSQRQTTSKVESSAGGGSNNNNNGSSTSTTSNGKSFADLPADAKAACERQANWVVGEGRAFKDMAAWRKHYVNAYFNS